MGRQKSMKSSVSMPVIPKRSMPKAEESSLFLAEASSLVKQVDRDKRATYDEKARMKLAGIEEADINAIDPKSGCTLLFSAAAHNDSRALRLMISRGADPEVPRRHDEATPAYIAAKGDCEQALKVLIAHKVDLDQVNHVGATPVMAASAANSAVALKLLINQGADLLAARNDGACALYLAARRDAIACMLLLIKHGADIEQRTNQGATPMFGAACCDQRAALELLLEQNAEIDKQDNKGQSACYEAAASDSTETLALLLEPRQAADYEQVRSDGATPLIAAATKNAKGTLKLLLAHSQSEVEDNEGYKERPRNDGCTPLWLAAQRNQVDCLRVLIDAGCNINVKAHDGATPLFAACLRDSLGAVRMLVEYGALLQAYRRDYSSCMHACAMRNSLRCCRALVQHKGMSPAFLDAKREDGATACYVAAARGSSSVLDILLSYRANPRIVNTDGQSALYAAAQHGQVVTLRQLVKSMRHELTRKHERKKRAKKEKEQGKGKGKEKDGGGSSSSSSSSSGGGSSSSGGGGGSGSSDSSSSTEDPKLAAAIAADLNFQVVGVVNERMCAPFKQLQVIFVLLLRPACQRVDGSTALFVACMKGSIACAVELLDNGASVNMSRHDDTSPLAIACIRDHDEIFPVLRAAGARLDACREDGATLAYLAAANNAVRCLELLIAEAADIHSARDMDGQTPTYVACQNGHIGCLELLLQQQCDAELPRDDGYTPLYVSARRKQHACVAALIDAKADPDSMQEDGQTALMAACRGGNVATVKLLLGAGGNGFLQSDEVAVVVIGSQCGYLADDYAAERGFEDAAHAVHVHCLRQANIIRQLQSAFFHSAPQNFYIKNYKHRWDDDAQYKIELGQEPTPDDEVIYGKCHAFVLKNFLNEHRDFPFKENTIRDALNNYRDESGERIANNRVRIHFKHPRPCEKWACLLTMEPIDKSDKKQHSGLLGAAAAKLKFW